MGYYLKINPGVSTVEGPQEPRYQICHSKNSSIAVSGLPMPAEIEWSTDTEALLKAQKVMFILEVPYGATQVNLTRLENFEGTPVVFTSTNQYIDAKKSFFTASKNGPSVGDATAQLFEQNYKGYMDIHFLGMPFGTTAVWWLVPSEHSETPYFEPPQMVYACNIAPDGTIYLDPAISGGYRMRASFSGTFDPNVSNYIKTKMGNLTTLSAFIFLCDSINVAQTRSIKVISPSFKAVKGAVNNEPNRLRRVFHLVWCALSAEKIHRTTELLKRSTKGIRRADPEMTSEHAIYLLSVLKWYDPTNFFIAIYLYECLVSCITARKNPAFPSRIVLLRRFVHPRRSQLTKQERYEILCELLGKIHEEEFDFRDFMGLAYLDSSIIEDVYVLSALKLLVECGNEEQIKMVCPGISAKVFEMGEPAPDPVEDGVLDIGSKSNVDEGEYTYFAGKQFIRPTLVEIVERFN